MNTSKHIGTNLYLYTNQTEIIDYLVDFKLMPKDLSRPFVKTNLLGMDFDLILFVPDEKENKFMHFRFVDFASQSESIVYLISIYKELAKENYSAFKPVQSKLEELLYMLPTFRALFKYTFKEESNELVYSKL